MRKTTKTEFYIASRLALTIALVALSACTKSKETLNKVESDPYSLKSTYLGETTNTKMVINGQLTDTVVGSKEFQLSRGVEEADSENTVGATPGMSDDLGLVKARITADEIQFVQTYNAASQSGRSGTDTIVASYKIASQFDIKRETNDYNDETNKIIEDKTNGWMDRKYMRVDWAHSTSSNSSFAKSLSGKMAAKIVGAGEGDVANALGVLTEENTSLLETPKIEPGHISFLTETSIAGGGGFRYVFPMSIQSARSFRVVYRTHLTEIKPSDYKPVSYTTKDFERFGYFFTQQNFDDPRGMLEKNIHLFANTHNVCEAGGSGSCATNTVRWVLSKDFPEKYKATARKVVSDWNKTFQTALNRADDVVFLDEATQATISDPTQNVLALYPSATKSGLLGVAQWISNPRTGELNGVRATVYGGGIDSVVASVDDKINLLVSNDPLKDVIGTSAFGSPNKYVSPFDDRTQLRLFKANQKGLGLTSKKRRSALATNTTPSLVLRSVRQSMDDTPAKANIRMVTVADKARDIFAIKELALLQDSSHPDEGYFPSKISGMKIPDLQGMERMAFASARVNSDKSRILRDAELGIHGTELVEDAAVRFLYNYLKGVKTPAELEAHRAEIEEEIAQLTFYTTALHEMGHAFGLRHNFEGSADQAHYPAEYKAVAAKLAKGDKSVTVDDLDPLSSSSIMDYGRDFFSQSVGLGPYDKAAIKYAYNRSINRDSDPVTLAGYKFCTDHMVDESILCRRFDKGSNVSEITQANIDLYDHSYALWHYRRGRVSENNSAGWGNPGALVGTLLSRVFIPTRQVMDEFLYSLIAAKPADGQGYCSLQFVKASVDAGEIQNICSQEGMAAAGVDPSDLGTFANALFQVDKDGNASLLKPSSTYLPYGLADLLWANTIAQTFFQRVIGAPEPGTYLPVPLQQGVILKPIDPSQDVAAQAQTIAQDLQMPAEMAAAYTAQAPELVTEIKVGGYGRQLDSRTSTQGGWIRNESLGSFWDKYAAIIALSSQDMGVRKYMSDSMVGNAYFFPQTKNYTLALMNKLITGNEYIASIPVTLKNGAQMQAMAPASLNADTAAISGLYALVNMTSSTDSTMLDRMKICDVNQGECSASVTKTPVVEFHAANGSNVFRASQTLTGDSIAFDLLTQAKAIDDQRLFWLKLQEGAGQKQTDALLKLDQSDVLRDKILAEIAKDPTLSTVKLDAAKKMGWADYLPKQWDLMKQLTKMLDKVSPAQGYQVGLGIAQAMGALSQQTDAALVAMGESGKCWVQANHPEAIPKDLVSGASKAQMNALLTAKAGDPLAPIDVVPAPTNALGAGCDAKADQAAGEVRLNLLLLQADMAIVMKEYINEIIVNDVQVLQAPTQINQSTNTLSRKQSQIERLRQLIFKITH